MANGNTILVVDDNEQNLYLLEVLLKSQKFNVVTAKDGKDALAKARQNIPHLIISDILMPVMDGFSLCRRWKRDDLLKKVPFIFYTATYTEEKDKEYALSIGADKFMIKPMEPDLFLEQIHAVLEASLEKSIPAKKPLIYDKGEDYKLYSERLVIKLEKKMIQLEEEIERRMKVENELRESKKEWKEIFQAIGNPTFIIDPHYNILKANRAALKATKISEDEIVGQKCHHIFHKSPKPLVGCPMCSLIESNQVETAEIEMETLQGSFLVSSTPVFDDNENLAKVIHMSTDITDLKEAEKSVRESEKKFRGIFENAHIGIVIADKMGRMKEFNDEFRNLLGYSTDELTGMNFSEITFPDDLEKEYPYFEKIVDGVLDTFRLQKRYIRKDKKIIWVEITVSAVRDPKGEIKQIIGMVLDIDEQRKTEKLKKELEDQLRQAQKMEAIGNLAGGIAHDFNNILASIIGFAELTLSSPPDEENIEDNLREILKAGNRAKDLVKQILTFARKSKERLKPVSPRKIGLETIEFLRSTTPSNIEITAEFESSSQILASPTQIHQLLMNISTNSIQSMEEEGGVLKIRIYDEELTLDRISKVGLQPGSYLVFEIADTGKGIPPNDLEFIFEPYFTTKEPGKGTGLGLSTAHGIVKSCSGEMLVESQVNKGTVFSIYFPVATVGSILPEPGQPFIPKGTERILFVDDEEPLADLGQKLISRLGYDVVSFTSSIEALEAFRLDPDKFDIVITDMTMPSMMGDKLSVELIKIRPDIPIILLTGFSKNITEREAGNIGIKGFAYKPLMLDQIGIKIRKILDHK